METNSKEAKKWNKDKLQILTLKKVQMVDAKTYLAIETGYKNNYIIHTGRICIWNRRKMNMDN